MCKGLDESRVLKRDILILFQQFAKLIDQCLIATSSKYHNGIATIGIRKAGPETVQRDIQEDAGRSISEGSIAGSAIYIYPR
ncbi:hypothetical protein U1Q18_023223 [Sarracenia purpurea var. burkii]